MRVLFDECLPARLARDLVGHDVSTAPKMGWAGLKNGALLTRAVDAGFDIFLTVDKNLPKQQKLGGYAIFVVVLRCDTNDIADLRKLVPELLTHLPGAKNGEALIVG
jgi:predicted nuclease of predicted toxin-antitoxin system